jgi:hypothetical protein
MNCGKYRKSGEKQSHIARPVLDTVLRSLV